MDRLGAQAALAIAFASTAAWQDPKPPVAPSNPPAQEAPRGAPPLLPIAGLAGFDSVSTIVYVAAPDRPHKLEASYVFPDRARWRLSVGNEKGSERQIQYRFGQQAFLVLPGKSESTEWTGIDRSDVLRQMELRRALMLWPDGFAWKGSGTERSADLGSLGSLRARFAVPPGARPVEIEDLDASGQRVDAFRSLTWRELDHRHWPAKTEYWHGD